MFRAAHTRTEALSQVAPYPWDMSEQPSGELERLSETIEVHSDTEAVRDLLEGLADAEAGRVFSADQIAADLAARRARE